MVKGWRVYKGIPDPAKNWRQLPHYITYPYPYIVYKHAPQVSLEDLMENYPDTTLLAATAMFRSDISTNTYPANPLESVDNHSSTN